MTNDTCPWHLFDEKETELIDGQLIFLGKLSALFIWILITYWHPTVKNNLSYLNMLFFFTSALTRRASPAIMFMLLDAEGKSQQGLMLTCGTLGFLETFMAIHEVECLTHICIERYVAAKYIANGWPMIKRHYIMFRLLSLFFAAVYSLAPVLGVGSYGWDFTCTSCTMDLVLPDGLMKYFVVAIFALRSIKPVGFMIIMLIWAKRLESKFADTPNNRMHKQATQDAIVMTVVSLIFWTPIGLVRGWVVLSQLLYGPGVFSLPHPFIIKTAILWHWSSFVNTLAILLWLSPAVRDFASGCPGYQVAEGAADLIGVKESYKKE